MRVNKTTFLFLCVYIPLHLFIGTTFFAQKKSDSLVYYYDKSGDKTLSIPQRINFVNKAMYLAKKSDHTDFKLKALNRKSYLYSVLGDYNAAISIAKILLKESRQANDSIKLSWAYVKLADYNRLNDSLFTAFRYYQDHKILNQKLHDSLEIIRDLRFMASIQYQLGLLYESESSVVEAITLLDLLKENKVNKESKVGLYNHLGIIYKELGDYSRALDVYNTLLKTTDNVYHLNIIHNNKANVYKEQQKFALAVVEFKKVYENSLKLKDSQQISRALNNLALVKSKLNYPEALSEMMAAIELREKDGNMNGLFSSFMSLSEYYKDRNDANNVYLYANKAYQITTKTTNYLDRIKALSYLIEIEGGKKIVEYKTLSDSIAKAKQANQNRFAFIKYNYVKKENEAQVAELKFKDSQLMAVKEKSKKTIYQFIAFFGLVFSIFFYYFLLSRHRKEKLQQVYDTETKISKKVHDEVANDVYHIMSKLQNNNNLNDVLDKLENVYYKTRDISKENSIVDVAGNYQEILKDLLQSYKNKNINVITKNILKVDLNTLSDIKKITLYRVLQELMTNMRKHSKATVVLLVFNKINKKMVIDYTDNGVGCKIFKKNGFLNTENRMASINGCITFESQANNGFKVKITL